MTLLDLNYKENVNNFDFLQCKGSAGTLQSPDKGEGSFTKSLESLDAVANEQEDVRSLFWSLG